MKQLRYSFLILFLTALLLLGCNQADTQGPPGDYLYVTLGQTETTYFVGETVAMTATATDRNLIESDVTSTATYASSNLGIASFTGNELSVYGEGSTTITVSYGGVSDSLTLTTYQPNQLSISATNGPIVPLGSVEPVTANMANYNGESFDVSARVIWNSTQSGVGQVEINEGIAEFMPYTTGQTDITASLAGRTSVQIFSVTASSVINLEIYPPIMNLGLSHAIQTHAIATFSDGSTRDVSNSANWSSSAPNFGIAPLAEGILLTPTAIGATTLSASYGGQTASINANIFTPAITYFYGNIGNLDLAVGDEVQFKLRGALSDGIALHPADLSANANWNSSLPAAVQQYLSPKGLFQAVGLGTSQITGDSNGTFTNLNSIITVGTNGLQLMEISPSNLEVPLGASFRLEATQIDAMGRRMDASSQASWTSSDPVNLIPLSGQRFQAFQAGTYTLIANTANLSASTKVTVVDASLQSISISHPFAELRDGLTMQLSAFGTYSNGKSYDITESVVWSSDSPTLIQVTNKSGKKGLAHVMPGATGGTAQITASLNGVSVTQSLNHNASVLNSISLQPINFVLPATYDLRLRAFGNFADGGQQEITEQVIWREAVDSLLINDQPHDQGRIEMVTGACLPTCTIQASLGAITSPAANLTEDLGLPTGLQIDQPNPMMILGTAKSLTATLLFDTGLALDGTKKVVWTSSDSQIASIKNGLADSGKIIAKQAGSVQITASHQTSTQTFSQTTTLTILP